MNARPLVLDDVPLALALLEAEGWTFDEADLVRILRLGGGVVLEDERDLLGLLTLVHYDKLAWIGNVVVRSEARGRGAGAALVAAALKRARDEGASTVGLYSVPRARSLYERLGFRDGGETIVSLVAEATPTPSRSTGIAIVREDEIHEIARFDEKAAGDDRTRLLRILHSSFPQGFFAYRRGGRLRGFAVTKGAKGRSEIGPVVVEPGNMEALTTLLDAAIGAVPPGVVEVGVPQSNAPAMRHVLSRGFRPAFDARRMVWGAMGPDLDARATAAVAAMEKG